MHPRILLSNVFTSYGRFFSNLCVRDAVRHPLCFPSSISFSSHLWEAPPLFAVTANLTPRSCPQRVACMRSEARDPQWWGRQQHSTWPSWWCGPFRLLRVCRVPARTRIKDGSLNGPTTWRVTSAGGLSWATASCRTTGNVTRAAFGSMRSRLAVRVTHYLTFFGIGVAQKF